MKRLFLIALSVGLATACLKKDVLDKDLEGINFTQSDFYQSGAFENDFAFDVVEVAIDTITTSQGTERCRPNYTLKLKEAYVARLQEVWEDEARLIYRKGSTSLTDIEIPLGTNYGQSFTLSTPGIECDVPKVEVSLRLELIDPTTTRISAATEFTTFEYSTGL